MSRKQTVFPLGIGGLLLYCVWQMTGGNLLGVTHIGYMLMASGLCLGYALGKAGF